MGDKAPTAKVNAQEKHQWGKIRKNPKARHRMSA
jgi:hypothetical protein